LNRQPMPVNAFTNGNLPYTAIVNKQWAPPPGLPCTGSPAYLAPGANNPTGTMYIDNSPLAYYPEGGDWGNHREAHFTHLDVIARQFGFDSGVSEKASGWESLHGSDLLNMQNNNSHHDGRTYSSDTEDNYGCVQNPTWCSREEWVAAQAAGTWLVKWLAFQGALSTQDDPDQIVVDSHDTATVTVTGTWTTGTPQLNGPQVFGNSLLYHSAGTGSNTVRFGPRLVNTRAFNVYAWWINGTSQATNTPYKIHGSTTDTTVIKNQQTGGGQWVLLGNFNLGFGSYVEVSDNANGVVVADAILLDPS